MVIKVATEFKPEAAILNLILLNCSVSKFP